MPERKSHDYAVVGAGYGHTVVPRLSTVASQVMDQMDFHDPLSGVASLVKELLPAWRLC